MSTNPRLATWTHVRSTLALAGGSMDECDTLASIAMVEGASRSPDPAGFANFATLGDVAAQDETWGPSVTWFQIRTLKVPGTKWWRDLGRITSSQSEAAHAALYIARTEGYARWTVYRDKKHLAFMPGYRPPIGVYLVKPGDTPSAIAKRFNLDWKVLLINNGMNPDTDARKLQIGQPLHVYSVHRVEKGQTLYAISRFSQVPIDVIAEYNNLVNIALIVPGQLLKIPKVWPT